MKLSELGIKFSKLTLVIKYDKQKASVKLNKL